MRVIQGAALNELGRMEEAIENYTKAITLNPNYASAYFNLGNSMSSLNRFEEAIGYYNYAIQMHTNYTKAHANKAIALEKLNSQKHAENISQWLINLIFNWKFKNLKVNGDSLFLFVIMKLGISEINLHIINFQNQ